MSDKENIKLDNPMADLNDDVKYGETLQPNAHDALAKKETIVEMVKMGVTVFDLRVKKISKGKWAAFYGHPTSSEDSLKQIAEFIKETQNHKNTLYTTKLQ